MQSISSNIKCGWVPDADILKLDSEIWTQIRNQIKNPIKRNHQKAQGLEKPREVVEYEKNEAALERIRAKAYRQGRHGDTLVDCLRKSGLFSNYDKISDRQLELEKSPDFINWKNSDPAGKLGVSIF